MMLLPVLRPVQKQASRLLLAGGTHAVEVSDLGSLEVQPPTAVPVPAPHGMVDTQRPMNVLPLWQGSGRWPVAVENLLAQGVASASGASSSAEHPESQASAESQLQDSQVSNETQAQCVWQMDAHAVFPPGPYVWPAIFMTSDGCLPTGFPVAGVAHSDVTAQPPIQQPAPAGNDVVLESKVQEAPGALSSPRSLRTSASRKQRRRLKAAMAADAKTSPADEVQPKGGPVSPALPGLVTGPIASQAQVTPVSPGPVDSSKVAEPIQLWPPTPESTPPCSPRHEWPAVPMAPHAPQHFMAFPGMWLSEMPNVVEQSLPLSEMQVEELPDEELQECERMISQLESPSKDQVMEMLWTSAWSMSCTAGGTRVVQKALEVADTAQRVGLAEQLQGHVKEAFVSPHANHVLQKCIELIPPERLGFLLAEMRGHAVAAARHRYGCRVLERLLEHCPTEQTAPLVEEVLAGAPQLCRHTFGNFVVQHVLEHGTSQQKHRIVEVIHSDIQRLARHRVASHVVRCALKHSDPDDRQQLVQTIRKDPADLADLAHHHCGSFVVREMRRSDARR